ncbi:diguanylate cyclase (GGDEF) domain-containing protein [Roseateles sp. YR242]|uniref:putative bifunctional diguanylate cyclase/phosphodiesterase n=1 Tax=Roseateles sp. YR242 TaxID=1855305 RepID=UPI0008D2232C|nr:EAL domain-containing protein [Roseateles sp. YR242]SEK53474.1 diguanylate cyclase (GGDEF) domain-containing protein [Roseateles sp. YR242]
MSSNVRGAPSTDKGHWLQFSVTSVIAILLMCMVNLHFGLVEQTRQAQGLGQTLLEGMAPMSDAARPFAMRSALEHYHTLEDLALCQGDACRHAFGDPVTRLPCAEGGDWGLCVEVNSLQDPSVSLQMQLDPSGVYEDVGRDVGILVAAQMLGMVVWLLSSRRQRQLLRDTEQRLRRAATTDPLTGLLNRSAFDEVIDQALLRTPRDGWILYLDLDGFKGINDQHGHPIGDAVIVAIGGRLRNAFKADGQVARLGGDEFGILVTGSPLRPVEAIFKSLFDALEAPVAAHRLSLKVGGSVGAARLGPDVGSAAEAQRRADIAMYEAKRQGRHQAAVFDASQDVARQRDYRLRLDLRSALARDELHVAYQPLVNANGQLHALEALARWNHPTLGPIGPDVFIPLAEASGLIGALGQAVVRHACNDLVALRRQGVMVPRIAINISAQQLADARLTQDLLEHLGAAGLSPADLELEITETTIMDPDSRAPAQLERLAAEGFDLAIDDFGTGYSSFSRLQTLPARTLKLDRTFIRALDTPHGQLLARTMLDLGRQLGMICVAEGVETHAQADWLLSHQCEVLQGYLFGRPMPAEGLVQWALDRRAPSVAA